MSEDAGVVPVMCPVCSVTSLVKVAGRVTVMGPGTPTDPTPDGLAVDVSITGFEARCEHMRGVLLGAGVNG